MSSDLIIDSIYDGYSDFVLAQPLNYSDWNGHQIIWRDLPEVRSEMERRILEIYDSGNHLLAHQLANLYFEQIYPRYEIQLVKKSSKANKSDAGISELDYYKEFYARYIEETKQVLAEVGLNEPQPPLEPISEANYPTLFSWQGYCLENGISLSEPKSGGLKEFWKQHKKAVIVAVIVIVVAVTVTVIIVSTAGAGTEVAVATGTAVVEEVINSYNSSDESHLELQNFQSESQVTDGIRNFAKAIDATVVNQAVGPIAVIETNSIPKISDESLAGLVAHWNANLAPSIALGPSPSIATSEAILGAVPNSYAPTPTFELAPSSIPHPFYPPVQLKDLYGRENVSRWYEQFGLQYASAEAPIVPEESRPSTSGQEFVRFIESKLGEARSPEYKEQFSRPNYTQEFIASIENALAQTQDIEKYKRELWETQHDFVTATKVIAAFFEQTKPTTPQEIPTNNYASTLALNKPLAPIAEIPLLGHPNQSTIHYHCGIKNNFRTVVEGGLCLSNSLENQFAIQPHLIHSNNILTGLSLVQVEKLDDLAKDVTATGSSLPPFLTWPYTDLPWPETVLQHSHIQSSIEYEVENLTTIAHKIIETGNPNLKQVHLTFSNGGYVFQKALEQLTPEERATIIVITTGTTSIINNDLACEVYNIIGDKDWPSISCNRGLNGIEAAKERATIEMIPQNETQAVIKGHYFVQPEYQDEIRNIINNRIQNKYEIY